MANTKVTGALIADATITDTNIADGAVTAAKLTGITTDNIGEGTALYYTDARVGTYLTGNGYDTAANIIATITDSAPVTLDTLNELAAALGDDPNYATTTANLIGTKLPLAGGTLTGGLHINTTSLPQLLIQNLDGGTNAERIAIELNAGDIFKIRSLNDNNTTRVDNILTANILTGYVGIGTTSPDGKLTISAGAENQTGPVNAIRIKGPNAPGDENSSQNISWDFNYAGSAKIRASRGPSWGTKIEFLTNTSGQGSDNPGVKLSILDNGGITFNGDTAAANALDDYEEGTWTPGINGYSGVTYSQRSGHYTKIGRLVQLTFSMTITNIGTFLANTFISGIPFSSGTTVTTSTGGQLNIMSAFKYTRDYQYAAFYNGSASLFIYSKTGGAFNGNDHQAGTYSGTITYFTS